MLIFKQRIKYKRNNYVAEKTCELHKSTRERRNKEQTIPLMEALKDNYTDLSTCKQPSGWLKIQCEVNEYVINKSINYIKTKVTNLKDAYKNSKDAYKNLKDAYKNYKDAYKNSKDDYNNLKDA